jgi:hypothetical protein
VTSSQGQNIENVSILKNAENDKSEEINWIWNKNTT